jgi:hypothetical protein
MNQTWFMPRLFRPNRDWQGPGALVPVDLCYTVLDVLVGMMPLGSSITAGLVWLLAPAIAIAHPLFWIVWVAPRAGPPPALPAQLNTSLHQSARELDIDRLTSLMEEVREFDPVFAGHLGLHAAQFDYESLVAVLPAPSAGRSEQNGR